MPIVLLPTSNMTLSSNKSVDIQTLAFACNSFERFEPRPTTQKRYLFIRNKTIISALALNGIFFKSDRPITRKLLLSADVTKMLKLSI